MERGKIIEHLKSVVRFIIVEKQNIKFLQILISQILYAALYLNISIYVYFIRTSIFFILAHTLRRVHNFIVSIQIKWHINVNYIYINIIYIYTHTSCYPKVPEIGMPRENRLFTVVCC